MGDIANRQRDGAVGPSSGPIDSGQRPQFDSAGRRWNSGSMTMSADPFPGASPDEDEGEFSAPSTAPIRRISGSGATPISGA